MIKMKNVLPEKYESILTLNETQKAIKLVKDTFDKEKIEIPYTTVDINVRK